MLYLLYSHFVSSQRFLYSLPLLILVAYPLQVIWLVHRLSYPPLDNTSNISLSFLVSLKWSHVVYQYVWCKIVNGILCKCYASLIVAHDGCPSFLHISHIHQKLHKPNYFLHAMASGHVLCLCHRQCNGWLVVSCISTKWFQRQDVACTPWCIACCLHLPPNPHRRFFSR